MGLYNTKSGTSYIIVYIFVNHTSALTFNMVLIMQELFIALFDEYMLQHILMFITKTNTGWHKTKEKSNFKGFLFREHKGHEAKSIKSVQQQAISY